MHTLVKRFFGDDARPIAQVVSRRHPLAVAMYAVVFFLGLVFVLHWYGVGHTESRLFPGVSPWAIFAWKWMMVVGGGGALLSLMSNPRPSPHWPDIADLLHIEGIFAIVAAFGVTIYLVVIVHLSGWHNSAPAQIIYGIIVLGHLIRAHQAIHDANRLEVLAEESHDVRP